MLDKEKLKAKREKEMEESLNLWQTLLDESCSDDSKKNKDEKKK